MHLILGMVFSSCLGDNMHLRGMHIEVSAYVGPHRSSDVQ